MSVEKKLDDAMARQRSDQRDRTAEGPARETEEDLQPRDAREMSREPQNPVNPEPDAAT